MRTAIEAWEGYLQSLLLNGTGLSALWDV